MNTGVKQTRGTSTQEAGERQAQALVRLYYYCSSSSSSSCSCSSRIGYYYYFYYFYKAQALVRLGTAIRDTHVICWKHARNTSGEDAREARRE